MDEMRYQQKQGEAKGDGFREAGLQIVEKEYTKVSVFKIYCPFLSIFFLSKKTPFINGFCREILEMTFQNSS